MMRCKDCGSTVSKNKMDMYKCNNRTCDHGKMYEQDFLDMLPDWVELVQKPIKVKIHNNGWFDEVSE